MTLPRKEVLTALVERWRELVDSMEALADNPHATAEHTETARMHPHTLLGTVTLKPRDGIPSAHPARNAKGLVETRALHINTQELVAGG